MEDSNVLSLSKALDRVSIHDAPDNIVFVDLLTTKTRLRKKHLKCLFTLNLGNPSEPDTIVALAAVEIVINTVVQLHINVSSRFLVVRAPVKMFMSDDPSFCRLRSYLEDRKISKVFADVPSPFYSTRNRPVLCAMDMARLCNVFLPIDTPVVTLDNFEKCPKWFSDSKRPPSLEDLVPLLNQLHRSAVSLERFESAEGPTLKQIFHLNERNRAFDWRAQSLLLREVEISKRTQVTYRKLEVRRPKITVLMSQYASRIREQSRVFIYFRLLPHEDVRSSRAVVRSVHGKQAMLEMNNMPIGLQPNAIVKIVLNRRDEDASSIDLKLAHLLERFNAGNRTEFVSVGSEDISRMLFEPSSIYKTESISRSSVLEALRSRSSLLNAWKSLNLSQKTAVQQCLSGGPCVKSVSGPPGTGKTRAIAMLTALLHTQAFGDKRIICCAQTNTAARHIASQVAKLCSSESVGLLVSQEFYKEWHEHEYVELLQKGYKKSAEYMMKNIQKYRVLICTISHCLTSSVESFVSGATTVVFDEASQVWDSHARALLTVTKSLKRLCLFGDLAQLPPHFPKRNGADGEVEMDLRACTSTLSHVDGSMLDISYRLPSDLCYLISCMFYGERLKAAKSWNKQSSITWHVVQDSKVKVRNGSTVSALETSKALEIVQKELRTTEDIAIVCFYEAQRKEIAMKLPSLMVKNVDGFQGQEADVIILCLSHQRGSAFLDNPNRMNVACTRAKQRLHIVGNPNICNKLEKWRRVFDFSRRQSKDWDIFEGSMA